MKNYNEKSKNLKILIAEDDFLVSEMIEGELLAAGYEVIGKASNGKIAVELALNLKPDLVLMDIRMPVLSGLEASKQIMDISPTPIIILTAYENRDMVIDAGEAGVAAYLNKPLDVQELERAILISMARFKDIMKLREKNIELDNANTLNIFLMKEIHHRVKNNFQLISSLFNLQIGSISDNKTKHILESGRDRVQTLAILHEKLYETGNLVSLPINIFVEDLLKSLLEVYNSADFFIKLDLNLASIVLDSKKAVTIGLILNEAVTNSIKYAFKDKTETNNTISVSMVVEDKIIILSIKDNGIGYSDIDALKDGDTLGMQLILLLTESQLGGSIEFPNSNGMEILIRFKP